MRCPFCKEDKDRVIDSRSSDGGRIIRRRRQCLLCKRRFTTYEKINDEDIVTAKDNISFEYKNIQIKADYMKINLSTNLLFASGKVYFKQDTTKTYCEEISYNWKTKKIILQKFQSEITGENIKGKIFYEGEKLENFPKTVEFHEGSFTTCDLEEPHYHIVEKEMIIPYI